MDFTAAVDAGDLGAAAALLREDPSLAGADPRAPEDRDPHTTDYPLVRAAARGDLEMVRLLLDHGADVDALSPMEDQREVSMPLHEAVVREHFDVADLLIDRGANPNGAPYCARPIMQRAYERAMAAGMPAGEVRRSFARLLGEPRGDAPSDGPPAVRTFHRLLDAGGEVNIAGAIRAGNLDLFEDLLRVAADEPAPITDWPHVSVLRSLAGSASWFGYPQTLALCLRMRPEFFDAEVIADLVHSALITHNRDGSEADFREVVRLLLDHARERGVFGALVSRESFRPWHRLASDYGWPRNYGYRADICTGEGAVEMAALLASYALPGLDAVDAKTGHTPRRAAEESHGRPCKTALVDWFAAHSGETSKT